MNELKYAWNAHKILLDIIMNYAIRELIKSLNYIRPFNDVLNENFMAFSTPKTTFKLG